MWEACNHALLKLTTSKSTSRLGLHFACLILLFVIVSMIVRVLVNTYVVLYIRSVQVFPIMSSHQGLQAFDQSQNNNQQKAWDRLAYITNKSTMWQTYLPFCTATLVCDNFDNVFITYQRKKTFQIGRWLITSHWNIDKFQHIKL